MSSGTGGFCVGDSVSLRDVVMKVGNILTRSLMFDIVKRFSLGNSFTSGNKK